MNYQKWFDPGQPERATPAGASEMGDRTESVPYYYQPNIELAVNVAFATRRPVLVSGPSGCGKTTLAADIARVLGWGFEKEVVTSRTQAVDLLYRVDHLRQLQDTRTGLQPRQEYVTPGVLWRAFDPEGAAARRSTSKDAPVLPPGAYKPERNNGVVVLVDEIDKAEPDVPNNLLEPFGSYSFTVDELGFEVRALRPPLLVVTTNNERRLPDAFIRRCVDLTIALPDKDVLTAIGERHFKRELEAYRTRHLGTGLLADVADAVIATGSYSTAEYLDTIRCILNLGVDESSANYGELTAVTVKKSARSVGQ